MRKGTATQEFCSCNILMAEVGTNCPCGGDGGHGGMTALRLTNEAGTCWQVAIDGAVTADFREIVLFLQGDTECETFIDALEWAARTLRAQTEANCRVGAPMAILKTHCEKFREGVFNDPFADDEPRTEIVKDAEGRDGGHAVSGGIHRPRWKG